MSISVLWCSHSHWLTSPLTQSQKAKGQRGPEACNKWAWFRLLNLSVNTYRHLTNDICVLSNLPHFFDSCRLKCASGFTGNKIKPSFQGDDTRVFVHVLRKICVCVCLTCFVSVLCSNTWGYVSLALVLADASAAGIQADHLLSGWLCFSQRCCRCRWRGHVLCHITWREEEQQRSRSREWRKRKVMVRIRNFRHAGYRIWCTSGCSIVSLGTRSHQLCIQAAVVRGNPVFSAAPDVASFPAPPAGQLWSLPPADAPSVTSYTDTETQSVSLRWETHGFHWTRIKMMNNNHDHVITNRASWLLHYSLFILYGHVIQLTLCIVTHSCEHSEKYHFTLQLSGSFYRILANCLGLRRIIIEQCPVSAESIFFEWECSVWNLSNIFSLFIKETSFK